MSVAARSNDALLSMRRALSGVVHPQLLQASVEVDVDAHLVRARFEYDGNPNASALEACQIAGSEIISDFPDPWRIEEEHCAVQSAGALAPLRQIAYRRSDV